jgi:hypothetical protein
MPCLLINGGKVFICVYFTTADDGLVNHSHYAALYERAQVLVSLMSDALAGLIIVKLLLRLSEVESDAWLAILLLLLCYFILQPCGFVLGDVKVVQHCLVFHI